MNHSLDIDMTPNFELTLAPLTFNNIDKINGNNNNNSKLRQRRIDSKDRLELPAKLIKKLNQFEACVDEEKKSENIWQATKSQFLSQEDEQDLEQSMKDQMSDIRRASRVSADVQFVSQILSLSNHADIGFNEEIFKNGGGIHKSSITSLRSFKHDNRINTIIESDNDPNDDIQEANKSYRVKKILNDHHNGYQVHKSSLRNLNKSELMYLCTIFAKNCNNKKNNGFKDETDKIIQSHEEQIQFLSKELNRLQKYHQHSHSFSLQSQDVNINMIIDDDEKFEQSMTESTNNNNKHTQKLKSNRDESPSSSRIDPMAALNENAPLVVQNGKTEKNNHKIQNINIVDNNEKVIEKQRNGGCADNCIIL